MAQKIVLEVDVRGAELNDLNTQLDKTEKNFNQTQKAADKTSKSVKDVGDNGGAIALLDSVTGGLATRLRDAGEASKLFNFSLKGTRAALIATGIGAFVVALGVVVAYWDEISDAIKGTTKNLEVQLAVTKSVQTNLQAQLATIDKQLELTKLQGKGGEELQKQKVAILLKLKEQNDAEVLILENQLSRLEATATEVGFWDTIASSVQFTLFGTKGLAAANSALAATRLTDINKLRSEIDGAKMAAIDLEIALFKIANPEGDGSGDTAQVNASGGLTAGEAVFAKELEVNEGRLLNARNAEQMLSDAAQEGADYRTMLAQMEADAKLQAGMQYANALSGISNIVGKESQAGKAVAIASTLVNTYLSAQLAYRSQLTATPDSPIRAAIAAGVAIATGLKNVAAIKKVKIPGGGGGGGGFSGAAAAPTAPAIPNFNVVGNTGINQLNDTINNQQNQPTRAFVTWGDIQKASDIESQAVQEATI